MKRERHLTVGKSKKYQKHHKKTGLQSLVETTE